jgi:hypothetical protein
VEDEEKQLNEEDLTKEELSEIKRFAITPEELKELRILEEKEQLSNLHPPLERLSIDEERKLTQLREKETHSGVWKKIRQFLKR